MNLLDTLRADGSIVVNKNLIFAIGRNEAEIYSELVSKYYYFKEKNALTADGYFFNTVNNLRLDTCLGEKPQKKAINTLVNLGLVIVENRGIPKKRYFKIIENENKLESIIEKGKNNRQNLAEELNERNEYDKERYKGAARSTFVEYANSLAKGPERLSGHQKEQLRTVEYFTQKHHVRMGNEHPRMTIQQWEKAINTMLYVDSVDDISTDDEKRMIDSYFDTTFEKGCNYSIMHYISGKTRDIRFFDAVGL